MQYTLEMLQKYGLVKLEITYDLDYSNTSIGYLRESYSEIQTIENPPQLQVLQFYHFTSIAEILIEIFNIIDIQVLSEKICR